MFSPDSIPFKLCCFSLYGRTDAKSEKEVQDIIEVIKGRRRISKSLCSDALEVTNQAFGFTSQFELMGEDE